ncbi:helix-hairpin-helix domain-containing protein [Lysobacter sp. A3-1-A15]|uniref:helix-hairpin-helix domain-containing protein n=1 Tax=Novilysobacter viscosus TaxID=3098602 RepID=UPI002ED8B2AE
MRKARTLDQARRLEDMPNVGPAIAADLRALDVEQPCQLRGRDPVQLYVDLCTATGRRHDPCVLDTFMAVVAFAERDDARPWWSFTAGRQAAWPGVEARLPPALRKA